MPHGRPITRSEQKKGGEGEGHHDLPNPSNYTTKHSSSQDSSGWKPKPTDWISLGGESGNGILHAVSNKANVVMQGPDRSVWHKLFNGVDWIPSASQCRSLGGSIDGPPVLSPLRSMKLEVFARGTNDELMHWGRTSITN